LKNIFKTNYQICPPIFNLALPLQLQLLPLQRQCQLQLHLQLQLQPAAAARAAAAASAEAAASLVGAVFTGGSGSLVPSPELVSSWHGICAALWWWAPLWCHGAMEAMTDEARRWKRANGSEAFDANGSETFLGCGAALTQLAFHDYRGSG